MLNLKKEMEDLERQRDRGFLAVWHLLWGKMEEMNMQCQWQDTLAGWPLLFFNCSSIQCLFFAVVVLAYFEQTLQVWSEMLCWIFHSLIGDRMSVGL